MTAATAVRTSGANGGMPAGAYGLLLADTRAEYEALDRFVTALPTTEWDRPTAFFGWTVRDQILHLFQVDRFGLISLRGTEAFRAMVAEIRAAQAQGVELSAQVRQEAGAASREQVLGWWRAGYRDLLDDLAARDPKARMAWFGPDMGLMSFASARLMEVWAHGQDIYDLVGVVRPAEARVRHVCELGVRTFAWSFRNRGLAVPPRPTVRLAAPDGQTWTWDGEGGGSVDGSALDFALVVTQRRAPEDTALVAQGDAATAWLPIAQCFAGAPQEPAAPGSRPPLA